MATDELTDEQGARLNARARLTQVANEHYHAGRFAAAAPLYHQALLIEEEVLGPEHPAVANSLFNLGNLYYVQEQYGEAEAAYRRALTLLERRHGLSSPERRSST
jgi:tetratricopeptide (TPR) repeat protein